MPESELLSPKSQVVANQSRTKPSSTERATSIPRSQGVLAANETVDDHEVTATQEVESLKKTVTVDVNSRQRASSKSRIECLDMSTEEVSDLQTDTKDTSNVATVKVNKERKTKATSQTRMEGISADIEEIKDCNTKEDILRNIEDSTTISPHRPKRQQATSKARVVGDSSKHEEVQKFESQEAPREVIKSSIEKNSKERATSLSRVEGLDFSNERCQEANKKELSDAMHKSADIKMQENASERVIVAGSLMGYYNKEEGLDTLNNTDLKNEIACKFGTYMSDEKSRASSKTRMEGYSIDAEECSTFKDTPHKTASSVQAKETICAQQKLRMTSKERLEGYCNDEEISENIKDEKEIISSMQDYAAEKKEQINRYRASSKTRIEGLGTNTEEAKSCLNQGEIIVSIQETVQPKKHKSSHDRAVSETRMEGIDDEVGSVDLLATPVIREDIANVENAQNKMENVSNHPTQFGFTMNLAEAQSYDPTALPPTGKSFISNETLERKRASSIVRQEGYGTSIEETSTLIPKDLTKSEEKKAITSRSEARFRASSQPRMEGFHAFMDQSQELELKKELEETADSQHADKKELKERALSIVRIEGLDTEEYEASDIKEKTLDIQATAIAGKERKIRDRASSKVRNEGFYAPEDATTDLTTNSLAKSKDIANQTHQSAVSRNIATRRERIEGISDNLDVAEENLLHIDKAANAKSIKQSFGNFHRPTSQTRVVGYGAEFEMSKNEEFPSPNSVSAKTGRESLHITSRASSKPRQLGASVTEELATEGIEFRPEKVSARESRASKFEKSKIVSKSKQEGILVAGEQAEVIVCPGTATVVAKVSTLDNVTEKAKSMVPAQGISIPEESIKVRKDSLEIERQAKEVVDDSTDKKKAVKVSKQQAHHQNSDNSSEELFEYDESISATENLEKDGLTSSSGVQIEVQDQTIIQSDNASAFEEESRIAEEASLNVHDEDQEILVSEKPKVVDNKKTPRKKISTVLVSRFYKNFKLRKIHLYIFSYTC